MNSLQSQENPFKELERISLENPRVKRAIEFCEKHHGDQLRKGTGEPFYNHPKGVAEQLIRDGIADETTIIITLLHDTVEDTEAVLQEIEAEFGWQVMNGVMVLSKNTVKRGMIEGVRSQLPRTLLFGPPDIGLIEVYRIRLALARASVRLIKVYDVEYNTRDLENLKPSGIARKIHESETFYIPIAKKLNSPAAARIEENIGQYRERRAQAAREKGIIAVLQNQMKTFRESMERRIALLVA